LNNPITSFYQIISVSINRLSKVLLELFQLLKMPKNLSGGNKAKKGKNRAPEGLGPITYADKEQCYGSIVKNIGNGQIMLQVSKLIDKKSGRFEVFEAIGRPRGLLRKRRTRYIEGGLVLCSERSFETHTDGSTVRKLPIVDIILVYDPAHSRRIIQEHYVPGEFGKAFTTSQARTAAAVAAASASGSSKMDALIGAEDGFEFHDDIPGGDDEEEDAKPEEEALDIDDL
jgi:hypothetical protein